MAEELKIKGLTQAPTRQLARKFSPPPPGLTVRPPSRRSPPTSTVPGQPASPAPTAVTVKAEPRDGSEGGESSGPEERRGEGLGEQQLEPHEFPLVSIPGLAGNETNKGGFSRFLDIYCLCFAVEVLIKEENIDSLNPEDELELCAGDSFKCRLCFKTLDGLDTAKARIRNIDIWRGAKSVI